MQYKLIPSLFVLLASLVGSHTASAGAWTLHNAGTLCIGDYTTCDNMSPSAPTITAGDVIIIFTAIYVGGAGPLSLSTPAGYVRLDTSNNLDADTFNNARWFCRVATGGDSMPTLNWGGFAGTKVEMQAITFSGPNAPNCSTIVHINGSFSGSISGASPSTEQSLTITHNNNLVISVWTKGNSSGPVNFVSIGCPSDMTTGQIDNSHQVVDSFPQFGMCYLVETTAANVGTGTGWTFSGSPGSTVGYRFAISLEEQDSTSGFNPVDGPTYLFRAVQ